MLKGSDFCERCSYAENAKHATQYTSNGLNSVKLQKFLCWPQVQNCFKSKISCFVICCLLMYVCMDSVQNVDGMRLVEVLFTNIARDDTVFTHVILFTN